MKDADPGLKWYEGISRYQWLVLLIACLGWIFDIFEGQIFVASMRDAMPSLLSAEPDNPAVTAWNNTAFGFFLFGGAVGGVVFGIVGDRIGRSKTLIYTILFYSVFTCLSAFAQAPWQMVLLRFLVAMGTGGEWAVALAMVAEVMPTRSRPVMSSIFHASSVLGSLLAAATVALLIGNQGLNDRLAAAGVESWRVAFAVGVLPALLAVWIRLKLKEPESWERAKQQAGRDANLAPGRLSQLFVAENLRATVVGVLLASVGMVTFWGIHIYGKNALLRRAQADAIRTENLAPPPAGSSAEEHANFQQAKKLALDKHKAVIKQAEMLSMALNTIGGGLGPDRIWLDFHEAGPQRCLCGLSRLCVLHGATTISAVATPRRIADAAGRGATSIWVLHDGNARRLRRLLPRALPDTSAWNGCRFLFQYGTTGNCHRILRVWLSSEHEPRVTGAVVGSPVSGWSGRRSFRSRDFRRRFTGVGELKLGSHHRRTTNFSVSPVARCSESQKTETPAEKRHAYAAF